MIGGNHKMTDHYSFSLKNAREMKWAEDFASKIDALRSIDYNNLATRMNSLKKREDQTHYTPGLCRALAWSQLCSANPSRFSLDEIPQVTYELLERIVIAYDSEWREKQVSNAEESLAKQIELPNQRRCSLFKDAQLKKDCPPPEPKNQI